MLDVLEAGCVTLQRRGDELAAALGQAGNHVTSSPAGVEELPKKRDPARAKRKATKARSKSKTAKPKKKAQLALALAATAADGSSLPENHAKGEEGPHRGKRQALGMSFSKLRAAIQARRGDRRGEEESSEHQ
jgi:hypothetical protein